MAKKMDRGKLVANLRSAAQQLRDMIPSALAIEAEVEVTEMKRRCPVDIRDEAPHPGNLRNSLHAEEPELVGTIYRVIVATGPQAPYDIYVHEDLDAFHPIGEAKFMESVINESRPYMAQRVGRRIHSNKMRFDR